MQFLTWSSFSMQNYTHYRSEIRGRDTIMFTTQYSQNY